MVCHPLAVPTQVWNLHPTIKIYQISFFYLDIIHEPNNIGNACNFEIDGVFLGDPSVIIKFPNLPTYPANAFSPGKPYISGSVHNCIEKRHCTILCHGRECTGTEYEWEVLDSNLYVVSTNKDTVWVNSNTPGQYRIIVHKFAPCRTLTDTLTVHFQYCCTDSISTAIITSDTLLSVGDSVFLDNVSTGAQAYIWHINGESVSTASDLSFQADSAGTYTVVLYAVGADTACMAKDSIDIIVGCSVKSNFSWQPQHITADTPIVFYAPANEPDVSYTWLINDSIVGSGDTLSVNLIHDKYYTITLQASGAICGRQYHTRIFLWQLSAVAKRAIFWYFAHAGFDFNTDHQ